MRSAARCACEKVAWAAGFVVEPPNRGVKRPFLEVVLGVDAGDEPVADDPLGAF